MASFASFLSGAATAAVDNLPVIDQTGLDGGWDIDVQYTPEALTAAALAARPNIPPGLAALASQVDPNGPTLRQALPDQLGLKLEPKRLAIDVIVIDHIEVPEQ